MVSTFDVLQTYALAMSDCLEMIDIYCQARYVKSAVKGVVCVRPGKWQKVPCGKCGMCLENRRKSWMFRIWHEMHGQQNRGWFLTLTYGPKFVKRGDSGHLSLHFKDVQGFFKQLRWCGYYVKYICVGEYGEKKERPHYHLLLWTDARPEDLQFFWHYGHVDFGELEMASAMYTLKYIIQPKWYPEGTERPRAQFSRGIGICYLGKDEAFEKVYRFHSSGSVANLFSVIEGKKVALPRYYRDKILTTGQRKEAAKLMLEEKRKVDEKLRRDWVRSGNDERAYDAYAKGLRKDCSEHILKTTKYGLKL